MIEDEVLLYVSVPWLLRLEISVVIGISYHISSCASTSGALWAGEDSGDPLSTSLVSIGRFQNVTRNYRRTRAVGRASKVADENVSFPASTI